MNSAARPWLPADSIRIDLLDKVIGEALSSWRERWLPKASVSVGRFTRNKPSVSASGPLEYEANCGGMEIAWSSFSARYLTEEILGVEMASAKPADNDQQVINKLIAECIAGCAKETSKALTCSGAQVKQHTGLSMVDAYSASIETAKGELIASLRISRDLIINFCKNRFARTNSGNSLTERWKALGQTDVEIGCRVAGCSITLSEMTALEVGDVVRLDREQGKLVDLAINQMIVAEENFRLERSPDRLQLRLRK